MAIFALKLQSARDGFQMVHPAAQRAREEAMLDRVDGARDLAPAIYHLLTQIADAGGEMQARDGMHEWYFAEAVIAAANLKGMIRRDPEGHLGFTESLILTGPGWQAIGRQPPPSALALVWGWFAQRAATRHSEAAP